MTGDLMTRREALERGAALGLGALSLGALGAPSAFASGGVSKSNVTLNMLTWVDHYDAKKQLPAIKQETGITTHVTLGSDDAQMFIKAKETGNFDIVSADAAWVPYYYQQGLIDPFDIEAISVAKQLYPMARKIPLWESHAGYLAYPRAWSVLRIYYNPKYVSPAPTSWHVLLDKKYQGKFVRENQPTDIVAEAGLATGAKRPYNMTPAELSRAKDFLKASKPAYLKLVPQVNGVVTALANEEAWFTSDNLGINLRVKEAGGPLIKAAAPKEGVVGWMDAEMKMKASHNANRFDQFINAWGEARWIVPLFQQYKEAWFNEKAYKMLVNLGHKEVADSLYFNDPEQALKAHLKGPSKNISAYITTFNEVFGA